MLVSRGEIYTLGLIKRKENTAYEWEEAVSCTFKGRPANQLEKKKYRIQKGVDGSSDSTYLFVTNLPSEVKPGDKIVFIGKQWEVQSVGYYFESSLIINADIMTDEQIMGRCPKGIVVQ